MIRIHTSQRYSALCIMLLLNKSFFAAAPDVGTPTSPPDWRLLALQETKAPNYYYVLLDIANEDEFAAAAAEDPARDRTAVINQKMTARMSSIDMPAALPADDRTHVQQELQKAAQLLNNAAIMDLYNILGHSTFTFIQNTHIPLLQAFANKEHPAILKMTAQFLKSLSLEKSAEDAFNDANKTELLTRNAAENVPDQERTLADALGGILFESLDNKDKTELQRFIAAHPLPATGITVPYKNNVLKEYIKLLQCKLAGPACKKPETRKKKTDDEDENEPADGKKDGKADATTVDNKKVIEELEKINSKLKGLALPGIQQAKRYLTKVKPDERKYIKSVVTRALDDNKALKSVADAIRNRPIPQYQEFSKLIDAIYKEAGSF